MFDFKYIPDFHVKTDKEEASEVGVVQPGIERRNLKVLLLGIVSVGITAYSSVLIISSIARKFLT